MIVHGLGKTEAYLKDFVELLPQVEKVRQAYHEKKASDKDAKMKLQMWCERHFGPSRFNQDWRELFGTDNSAEPNAIARWDAFVASKPASYLKWYYSPSVVAGLIMGTDE